ncbi:MAG: hypothetical protein GXX94_07190 [Chloroflexi bacterium]|nr:hypothetical protein [Chloroflexota bacterium]
MKTVSAQIGLYPLGRRDLDRPVEAFLDALTESGLDHQIGPMSTLVWGGEEAVFAAIREGYRRATALGPAVMQITLSDACPVPQSGEEP